MILMRRYKKRLKTLNQSYFRQLIEIWYWNKVEKMFVRKRHKGVDKFDYEFGHDPGSYYDDAGVIEAIAYEYSYKIIDEILMPNSTVYSFVTFGKENISDEQREMG